MRLALLLAFLALAGCATNKGLQVGEGVQINSLINFIAADSAKHLKARYPNAKFALKEGDQFGEVLAGKLRKSGFELLEPGEKVNKLEYVFDNIGNVTYRVSLYLNGKTLSRTYLNESPLQVAGFWSEGGNNGK
jgi:hypothetical protein